MNRRNRSLASLMLAATVATHLAHDGLGIVQWVLLAAQFLAYPQLVYLRALCARDQREAEMNNLLLDGFFLGIWAAALGFPLWISFQFAVNVTVNMTVFRGRVGFMQALVSLLAGALPTIAIAGWKFAPDTSVPTTLLAIVSISSYVLLVAENGYARALKLHETRERLRVSEQELKRQLDEIRVLQSQLREQANRDPLTGLYNRRFFDEMLQRELARCRRNGQSLSVAMIDIDHFKRINDVYGHQAGDEVLKMLATILEDRVRASDVACRYGGEEFLVLLPGAPVAAAQERAEQWRASFAEIVVNHEGKSVRSTLSVGIASAPAHGSNPEELIRSADRSLYRAKTGGRNRVVIADALAESAGQ